MTAIKTPYWYTERATNDNPHPGRGAGWAMNGSAMYHMALERLNVTVAPLPGLLGAELYIGWMPLQRICHINPHQTNVNRLDSWHCAIVPYEGPYLALAVPPDVRRQEWSSTIAAPSRHMLFPLGSPAGHLTSGAHEGYALELIPPRMSPYALQNFVVSTSPFHRVPDRPDWVDRADFSQRTRRGTRYYFQGQHLLGYAQDGQWFSAGQRTRPTTNYASHAEILRRQGVAGSRLDPAAVPAPVADTSQNVRELAQLRLAEQHVLQALAALGLPPHPTEDIAVGTLQHHAEHRLAQIHAALARKSTLSVLEQGLQAMRIGFDAVGQAVIDDTTRFGAHDVRFMLVDGGEHPWSVATTGSMLHWQMLLALFGRPFLERHLLNAEGTGLLHSVVRGGFLTMRHQRGGARPLTVHVHGLRMSLPRWNPAEEGSLVMDQGHVALLESMLVAGAHGTAFYVPPA
jgi:hypothetical protein